MSFTNEGNLYQELDQISFRFFKLFARYESSLKERGFFVCKKANIIVDWDRFSNEVIGRMFLEQLGDDSDTRITTEQSNKK
ncbi:MAG: hypothetical protein WA981_03435 [Glaciecola sp.]